MGNGRWDPAAYTAYTKTTVNATTAQVFAQSGMHASLDPRGVNMRESRDSADNPQSTPIIVNLDVTGSMGMIADAIAREGLGTLFQEILDRKPVRDPHIMFMANGDVKSDRAPLQVSQFEADPRIIEQLTNIYLEGNGGGNDTESYNLPWYFAAYHTVSDSFQKREKKGYLFTIGDEDAPDDLTIDEIEKVMGYRPEVALTNKELLELVQRQYHVFHLMVEQGSHLRGGYNTDRVRRGWQDLLGERVILLKDYKKLSEVVVSLIEVTEGRDAKDVIASWDGTTAVTVAAAISNLPVARPGDPGAVIRLK